MRGSSFPIVRPADGSGRRPPRCPKASSVRPTLTPFEIAVGGRKHSICPPESCRRSSPDRPNSPAGGVRIPRRPESGPVLGSLRRLRRLRAGGRSTPLCCRPCGGLRPTVRKKAQVLDAAVGAAADERNRQVCPSSVSPGSNPMYFNALSSASAESPHRRHPHAGVGAVGDHRGDVGGVEAVFAVENRVGIAVKFARQPSRGPVEWRPAAPRSRRGGSRTWSGRGDHAAPRAPHRCSCCRRSCAPSIERSGSLRRQNSMGLARTARSGQPGDDVEDDVLWLRRPAEAFRPR